MIRSIVRAALLAPLAAFALGTLASGAMPAYPPMPRDERPDTYWGVRVPNPYRWLENVDSPQTQSWVKAQGDVTRAYLDAIPQRGAIKATYRRLLDYEKLQAPERAGSHWF